MAMVAMVVGLAKLDHPAVRDSCEFTGKDFSLD
jgi:hypothetical protein